MATRIGDGTPWGKETAVAVREGLLPMVRVRFPGVLPTAYADVDHTASAAMLHAAGFTEDGTLTGRYRTAVTRSVHPGNATRG